MQPQKVNFKKQKVIRTFNTSIQKFKDKQLCSLLR